MATFTGENLHIGFGRNAGSDSAIDNPATGNRGRCSSEIILGQAEGKTAFGPGHETTKAGKADALTTSPYHPGDRADIHQVGNLVEVEPAPLKSLDIGKGDIEIDNLVDQLIILIKAADGQGDVVDIGEAFRRQCKACRALA